MALYFKVQLGIKTSAQLNILLQRSMVINAPRVDDYIQCINMHGELIRQ